MTSSNGLNDPTVARRVLIVDELDSTPIDTWNVLLVEDFLCPISHELPVDPVIAEDGESYEREDIETLIRVHGDNLRSPMTNLPMGKKLTSATHERNCIQNMVERGNFTGEHVESYKKRKVVMEKVVMETNKKAEGGDYDAMASLRDWYKEGKNGLHKNVQLADKWYGRMLKKRAGDGDVPSMLELAYAYYHGRNSLEASSEEAYKWFKKAADLMDVTGMAEAGDSLARGDGVKANRAYGMALLAAAAGLGSAIACTYLASMYCDGEVGLPKDLQHAKFWYKKAIDGSCHTNDMNKSDIENVEKKIKEIEDAE